MKYILETNQLTKYFVPPLSFNELARLNFKNRKPVKALEDITFQLERGKILGILGPNGAGKTTLLKIIATLIVPDKGTISVNQARGNSISLKWPSKEINNSNLEEKIKSSIGMVVEEERSLYQRLTGRQNLEFFASLYKLDKKTAKTRIDGFLKLFEIDYDNKRVDLYSTGMKKKFALIKGLIHNPELLLLDEPAKSLDYTTAFDLRNFIKNNLVKEQVKSVIFTTHQIEEALDFADIFMILNKGKFIAMGTLDDLRKKINSPSAALSEIFLKLTKKYV